MDELVVARKDVLFDQGEADSGAVNVSFTIVEASSSLGASKRNPKRGL
jgi:hypothetical protein